MKMRTNPISEDFQVDVLSFDEVSTCDFEKKEDKPFPIKKVVVATVMAISLGMIINGVLSIAREPEVHKAIEVEDSKWSDFDTSKVNSYFNILSTGTEYQMLEAMCSSGSTVYSTIQNSEANIQYLYDENYGIAQGLQKFGSYISVTEINGVSADKVSLTIQYVSEADLVEFFHENSNDLARYFTSHEASKENLVRELFHLLDTYQISTSKMELELPVEMVDGVYTIADDSEVCDMLFHTYSKAVDEIVKQLIMHR